MEISIELNKDNNEKYKVKASYNNKVYTKITDSDHLLGSYYMILYKGYPEKKNI